MLGGYEWPATGVAFLIVFAIGIIYFQYMKRRYPTASDTDKAVWKLYIMTLGLGMLLMFGKFALPGNVWPLHVYPTDSQESKIEKLVASVNEQREALNAVNRTLDIGLYMIGMYVLGAAGLLSTIRKSRHEELLREDPELKKPLGL